MLNGPSQGGSQTTLSFLTVSLFPFHCSPHQTAVFHPFPLLTDIYSLPPRLHVDNLVLSNWQVLRVE